MRCGEACCTRVAYVCALVCWCVGVCVLQVHNAQVRHVQESFGGRHESFAYNATAIDGQSSFHCQHCSTNVGFLD